jgi:Linalool dehydratase/isomerase
MGECLNVAPARISCNDSNGTAREKARLRSERWRRSRSIMPRRLYNSPGYIGNGIKTHLDEIEASLHVAARRQPRAEHPYYPQHSPAVGRQYNPDPIYANGSSNMMYKGYFAHQLMLAYVMTGDQKFLQPQHLVYDDDIQYWYSVKDIVEVMNQQHLGDVDENGSPLLYGIDCEVGKVFPVCVSVGGLANHLYDKVFGTNYRKGYDRWLDWARNNVTGGHTEEDARGVRRTLTATSPTA